MQRIFCDFCGEDMTNDISYKKIRIGNIDKDACDKCSQSIFEMVIDFANELKIKNRKALE